MKQPEYRYELIRGVYCVFKMHYIDTSSYGSKVSTHFSKEEAEQETYRLNGWEYKHKNETK